MKDAWLELGRLTLLETIATCKDLFISQFQECLGAFLSPYFVGFLFRFILLGCVSLSIICQSIVLIYFTNEPVFCISLVLGQSRISKLQFHF